MRASAERPLSYLKQNALKAIRELDPIETVWSPDQLPKAEPVPKSELDPETVQRTMRRIGGLLTRPHL